MVQVYVDLRPLQEVLQDANSANLYKKIEPAISKLNRKIYSGEIEQNDLAINAIAILKEMQMKSEKNKTEMDLNGFDFHKIDNGIAVVLSRLFEEFQIQLEIEIIPAEKWYNKGPLTYSELHISWQKDNPLLKP